VWTSRGRSTRDDRVVSSHRCGSADIRARARHRQSSRRRSLRSTVNGQALNLIADVTFYGKDMHNNDISATGSIGITFANFGDSSS
jgi:hypothetical protein